MIGPRSFLASTIGQKVVMAVTGAILFGFVLAHLAGNLLLYQGPDAINAYGRELRTLLHGAALPLLRVSLLLAVVLHIWAAWSLTVRNAQARPTIFPVTPEFTNWRSEQLSWRTTVALLDQSHHMTDLFISGPDALRLLRHGRRRHQRQSRHGERTQRDRHFRYFRLRRGPSGRQASFRPASRGASFGR